MRAIDLADTVPGHYLPARHDQFDGQRLQIGRQDHVGAAPRREGADFPLETEVGGGIDRRHLERDQRIAAAVDGMADHAVHMAFVDERS